MMGKWNEAMDQRHPSGLWPWSINNNGPAPGPKCHTVLVPVRRYWRYQFEITTVSRNQNENMLLLTVGHFGYPEVGFWCRNKHGQLGEQIRRCQEGLWPLCSS